jgi:hypothetical protein
MALDVRWWEWVRGRKYHLHLSNSFEGLTLRAVIFPELAQVLQRLLTIRGALNR